MSQTSYSIDHAELIRGMISDLRNHTIETGINFTGASIPVGRGVVLDQATADNAVELPGAVRNTMYGVATLTHRLIADSSGVVAYADKDAVNVMRSGVVAVYCETACVAGGQVYMRFQNAGAGEEIGSFRNDVDAGDAVIVVGAVFKKTLSVAGLTIIEFNFPEIDT